MKPTPSGLLLDVSKLGQPARAPISLGIQGKGVHVGYHSVIACLRRYAFFDCITYGVDFSLGTRPRRLIIGLRTGELTTTYGHVDSSVRFLRCLHAKLYLCYRSHDKEPCLALVGSMNFVYSGLVECLVEVSSKAQTRALLKLFEHLWTQSAPR